MDLQTTLPFSPNGLVCFISSWRTNLVRPPHSEKLECCIENGEQQGKLQTLIIFAEDRKATHPFIIFILGKEFYTLKHGSHDVVLMNSVEHATLRRDAYASISLDNA